MMGNETRGAVGDALSRSIIDDINDIQMFLSVDNLKAINKALAKAQKRWNEGTPVVENVVGERKTAPSGPKRVLANGTVYKNMTAAFIDLGFHVKGDSTKLLNKFRLLVNTEGAGEYEGVQFELTPKKGENRWPTPKRGR